MNLYTKFYKKAAESLGLEYKIIEGYVILIKCKGKIISFIGPNHGNESYISHYITTYKNLTKYFLKQHNIPVFKSKTFKAAEYTKAKKYSKSILKYPIVIKPINRRGGIGVVSNIRSDKQFKKAFEKAKELSKKLLIEKHYDGKDYRFLVCKNKLLCVTLREPAIIKGNGQSTLKELVKERNKKAKFPLSVSDPNLINAIEKQKYSLNSIPKKKQIVEIYNLANFHAGGRVKNISLKEVHRDYKKIALDAVRICGLKLCGVDILTNDITKPVKITKGGITELNPFPGIEIHIWAKENPIPDIAEQIIKLLLKI